MKHTIVFIALLLICSCDNHDLELNEKEQEFYINSLLCFTIEPLDTLDGGNDYLFSKRYLSHSGIYTLSLRKKIPREIKGAEFSYTSKEFDWSPQYIKLKPNTRYIIKHFGMGAKVNITKYYYTDALGNLHLQNSKSHSP